MLAYAGVHTYVGLHMLCTASHVALMVSHVALYAPTEVVSDAASSVFVATTDAPPASGNRKADLWSVCFQGGTFDRIKERCGVQPSVTFR